MNTFMLRLLLAVGVAWGGVAQAELLGRDVNGKPVAGSDHTAVFLYDTDLDITWLRDANPMSRGTSRSIFSWFEAMAWADNLTVGLWSDWRLPKGDSCLQYHCVDSEMGHLHYLELGNRAGYTTPKNTGDFFGLVVRPNYMPDCDFTPQHCSYWSSTSPPERPGSTVSFAFMNGGQYWSSTTLYYQLAMIVRDGDVAAVPEPGAISLALAGLCVVVAATFRGRT